MTRPRLTDAVLPRTLHRVSRLTPRPQPRVNASRKSKTPGHQSPQPGVLTLAGPVPGPDGFVVASGAAALRRAALVGRRRSLYRACALVKDPAKVPAMSETVVIQDMRHLGQIMNETTLRWDRVLSSARWIHEGDLISQREGNRRYCTVEALGGIWFGRMSGVINREVDRLRALEAYDDA